MSKDELSCPSCGARVTVEDRFCERCGARVARSGEDTRDHAEIDLGIVAGVTDRGLVHERNEDALFISRDDGTAVVVICDGVSSSTEPHTAAQLAADVAGRTLVAALRDQRNGSSNERPVWDPDAATVAAIEAAQRAVVHDPATIDNPHDPPACTVVSAIWDGSEVTFGWVGDSRAYWIAADTALRITKDDAWHDSHTLTRWLGADAPPVKPGVTRLRPTAAGRVIVCSDGLWNYAAQTDELAALVAPVRADASAIAVAQRLTRAALDAGGHDNVTVAVVTIASDHEAVDSVREES